MAIYDTTTPTEDERPGGNNVSLSGDDSFADRFNAYKGANESSVDEAASDTMSDIHTRYGSIHPSFPGMDTATPAHLGSKSVSPYKGSGDTEPSEPTPRTDLGPGQPTLKGYGFAEDDKGRSGQRTQVGSTRGPGQHRRGK